MTSITIVHHNGSDVVEGFEFAEEIDPMNAENSKSVRVWYSDPKDDDSDYEDFHLGTITEVSP